MLIELRDYLSSDTCGLINVTHIDTNIDPLEEVEESWTEFNKLDEHELAFDDVDDFVEWHNEGRVTQIERVFYEIVQPS
jgi:hypothetical protein